MAFTALHSHSFNMNDYAFQRTILTFLRQYLIHRWLVSTNTAKPLCLTDAWPMNNHNQRDDHDLVCWEKERRMKEPCTEEMNEGGYPFSERKGAHPFVWNELWKIEIKILDQICEAFNPGWFWPAIICVFFSLKYSFYTLSFLWQNEN
jgi:hypothetical protein